MAEYTGLALLDVAVVLVAAGASTRMGFAKLWTDVSGMLLIARAIAAAQAARPRELVVVVSAERLAEARARAFAPAARVVVGGARRRDSVAAGLAATTCGWIAVHDAARALTPSALFERGFDAAQVTGAAVPGLPLKDTIKRVRGGRVVSTPLRAEHVAVQTPQVFRRDLLERALAVSDDDVTDESALVERLGHAITVFEGDERAFKITTPLDFALARTLLSE